MRDISPELIHTFSLLMILTSFAAVESRNLRHATIAYLGQALLICALLLAYSALNKTLLYWVATALITKVILVPWFLWRSTTGAEQETKPIIGFGLSAMLLVAILATMYRLTHAYAIFFVNTTEQLTSIAELNLAIAFTVFVLGLYSILTRRDAVKSVIGLCLLENGVHLSLVSLAPTIKETALAGIATEVVVTVYLLLYIIGGIRDRFGTADTFKLSELHW
ncbi:MAG: NADH-quinone oxidoreductase subunit K [Armatimonadetes bacterium]|nr:NADH-quinone oxidoreductase subunit K [Armatimonadota bacterium]